MINGGNTKLILQAMVQNYTTRIELLEEVVSNFLSSFFAFLNLQGRF